MVLIRLFLLISLTFVLGCNSSSSGGPARPGLDGTSDSGGGNGIENKAYEAYIVRPDQLPAFKMLIAPKINQLVALSPKPALLKPYIQRWMLYKTWYVAPVSLGTISKDVIGISFSNDKTEQLALQTKKSVWINSDRFNKMTLQDQAVLIIHEMVMSLYYLKFKSWNDICVEKIYPDIQCKAGDSDLLNEIFPGSTPRPFDTDDYENIRAVTGVFLNNFGFKSAKEIDDLLIANKFDRRFSFGTAFQDGEMEKERFIYRSTEPFPVATLLDVLSTAHLLNQLPDRCQGVRFDQPFDCDFNFKEVVRPWGERFTIPTIQLDTRSVNQKIALQFSAFIGKFGETNVSSIEIVKQKRKITFANFMPSNYPTPLKRGTFFRNVILVMNQDLSVENPPHTLLGIFSVPGIVTGSRPGYPDECSFAKPTASSIKDDVIMAYSKHLTDFDKNLLRMRAGSFPTFTSCKAIKSSF